ncbi:MAG: HyaD/HybD family hydrogenase maturation endopeptidase [Chlorobium sp.]|uniref:HyaD/HybD family hydrogenase maturation endopeptidase n=1 Tax=Chlorobium sp. TaxID=1095 RepID=UPI001E06B077|nr:HyaD/HybD family hydrogenase maturation endopeptidase [Chlorobium sp.]MBN1278302.1 HyaD/HybD family hydrogenase maturation endopeptidase [Chlorobiaceae bacterium]MCF8216441.1 HyaD/HybD family hydrogenase maturation endopeptidase [Chlorobium sp.]MCF8271344.1 HyaD/HybD family hydrogenase maturation endopeptidase [Chlorobium sp.]MCF8287718.1 HyaD/HybD family hydrogenase maturation endopeptidase [Chlorobium sp.]MCF8291257.1 HyaD/HybD family hydrogenase maturation endopeptidase [Chlorobium sp.]
MKYNRINIIGLGNILFGDEGFGVEAIRAFEKDGEYPERVQFVDGGTQGLYLLDYIESCDAVMVFDALIPLDFDRRVYVYHKEELPAFIHRKMSSHQMGLSELLGIAQLHGRMPETFVMIGIPPRILDLGSGLSEDARELLDEAVVQGREILREWLGE